MTEQETPVHNVPEQIPLGQKCCAAPNIWQYSDGVKRCRVCGHNWEDSIE